MTMLMEVKAMPLRPCPRCWESGYQIFSTHSYCVDCNYSPDFDPVIQGGFYDACINECSRRIDEAAIVAAMQEMISPNRWTRLSSLLANNDQEQDVFEHIAEKLFARL